VSETTLYFKAASGAVKTVVTNGGADSVAVPEGMARISEKEHAKLLAGITTAHEEYVGGLAAEDRRRTQGDYEALCAVGIPEETAARLSGHQMES
jgi:hypothetical protein